VGGLEEGEQEKERKKYHFGAAVIKEEGGDGSSEILVPFVHSFS
jgi:hypothetical protein